MKSCQSQIIIYDSNGTFRHLYLLIELTDDLVYKIKVFNRPINSKQGFHQKITEDYPKSNFT